MINLNVPNLDDGPTVEELQQLAHVYSRLSQYCVARATAKRLRLEGNISLALSYELECETIYRFLPREAQW